MEKRLDNLYVTIGMCVGAQVLAYAVLVQRAYFSSKRLDEWYASVQIPQFVSFVFERSVIILAFLAVPALCALLHIATTSIADDEAELRAERASLKIAQNAIEVMAQNTSDSDCSIETGQALHHESGC